MNRRQFIGAAGVALVVATGPALASENHFISPADAHQGSRSGDILLIDVRTGPEWERSGVGEHAQPIAMQDDRFLSKLDTLTGGDKSKKVALICATGRRSDRVRSALVSHGYTNVLDVSEGMMGSENGPGWIRRGLPTRAYSQ